MSRQLICGDPVIGIAAPPIVRGAVLAVDGVIEAVGPRGDQERRGHFDEVLGSDEVLVLPGLVNAHHHAGRTFRSGLADAAFERRNVHLHRLVAGGTEESTYRNTLYSCVELLQAGVTAAGVIFYANSALPAMGADAALQAYLDSGMRVGFALAQRDRALYVHEDDEVFLARLPADMAGRVRASPIGRYSSRSISNGEYFDLVRALARRWHGRDDRVYIHLGPDWFPSCTDALLRGSRALATELATQIQIHLLETRYEMAMARRLHGISAAEHLERLGFLGPDVVCAHSVWLTAADIDIYARRGAIAVHNPASNLRLSSGIAPVREMLRRGVRVAVGTDGLSFADDNDLLSDLRLADQLQRVPGLRSERISTATWLEIATRGGAGALGLGGRVGELAPGQWADLVLIRKDRLAAPYVHPRVSPEDVLLWRARADDVDTVLVGGRPVVSGGEVRTADRRRLAEQMADDARAAFAPAPGREEWDRLADDLEPRVVALLEDRDGPGPEPVYRYNTR